MGQHSKQYHTAHKCSYFFTRSSAAIPSYYVSRNGAPETYYNPFRDEMKCADGGRVLRTDCETPYDK